MIDDIALIELREDVDFTEHAQSVCLPTENEAAPIDNLPGNGFGNCHMIGWGKPSYQSMFIAHFGCAIFDV